MPGIKTLLLKYLPHYYFESYQSYSQDGEDMILKAFYENKKHHKGFYVDVGAHHPVRYSNTYFFYKKGWRGINIEPTPTAITPFKVLRSRDINLNVGVASKKESLTFFCFNEPALNTFSEEVALLAKKKEKYKIIKKVQVEVLPLRDILNKYLPEGIKIDFLTVDVEGLDFDVLKSNDWDKFSPEYLLVEGHIDFEQIFDYDIYQFLKEKNYKLVAKTLRTLIFKHN
ncbi:MAG: FkbM family methyltransferase [Daejeonella sp.]